MVQLLVYSELEKDDLLFVFVVMGKCNYVRLRRNGVVRDQIS